MKIKNTCLKLTFSVMALFLLGVTETIQAQAPGNLDPTFGNNGIVATHLFAQAQFGEMTIQPDGKIIVVGNTYWQPPPPPNPPFPPPVPSVFVARFNTDGTLDATFDTDGYNNSPIGS